MNDQPKALRTEIEELREANEAFGRRQEWWIEKMFQIETEVERLREQLRLANIDALNEAAENEALRRDAERYRWLRGEHSRIDPCIKANAKYKLERQSSTWVEIHDLDAAIDAAMGGKP